MTSNIQVGEKMMLRRLSRSVFPTTCVFAVLIFAQSADAHFLWLKTLELDGKPHAYVVFGQSPADEAYHMPEPLLKTKVWSRAIANEKRAELATKNLEANDRVGLVAPLKSEDACVLEATQTYGIYQGTLLTYYAKHVRAESPKELNAAGPSKEHKLDIVPQREGDKLQFTVTWDGKPLENTKVSLRIDDEEGIDKKTDQEGRAEFKLEGDGLVSVLANYVDKSAAGKHGDDEYKGVMHYSSLTFGPPSKGESKKAKPDKPAATSTNESAPRGDAATASPALVPLPEPVSSFGAAVADGWLYVYGGHTGSEHEHSAANLSQHFRRIKLDGGAQWEDLAMQMPLQGLALVAHDGKLYRIGGLNARNATKEDAEDLHSQADFAVFDPATGKWASLAPLPTPRSSHNAVVIDGKLYVAGGWHLHGQSPGDWQADALAYDFAKPQAGWQKLPAPPFKRRAVSAGQWQGKLVVIGGMNENENISRRVDLFDPKSGLWTEGPRLPGSGIMAFGTAACDLDGQIFVTGLQGIVYRLNETPFAWEEAAQLDRPRFFHQLLPAGNGDLLAVGGATQQGHLADVERVNLDRAAKTATEKSPDSTPTPGGADAGKHGAGKTGVLLVSHGSYSPHWRAMLQELAKEVEQPVLAVPGIDGLRSAFMEYTEPSIATQLKAFDREGYQHVILVPLLLTVSSHSFDDIPTIIGAKDDAKSLAFMKAEGIERYSPQAKVSVAPLFDYSTLLEKNLPRRIAKLSKDPAGEGVVLVAYGSEPYQEEWDAFFTELGAVVKRQTGVALVKHCWCGHVVQYQQQPTENAIRDVLGEAKRAIVVPVLVAYDEMFQDRIIGQAVKSLEQPERVAYVPDAILPEPALNEWIVSVTAQIRQTIREGSPIAQGEQP